MQNVGTPRFYVDTISWLSSLGVDMKPEGVNVGINPTNLGHGSTDTGGSICRYGNNNINISSNVEFNFIAVLGHNHSGIELTPHFHSEIDGVDDGNKYCSIIDIVNSGATGGATITPQYDGFSIAEITTDHHYQVADITSVYLYQANLDPTPYHTGAFLWGKYYDMPHSPDLNLKLSYEYDGVKTIQTKNGSTLSNAMYTKPADWGDAGAWQIKGNPSYRTGRRTWNLSFSYLADTDVFPVNANQSHVANSTDGYHFYTSNPTTGFSDIAADEVSFSSNILDGQDFFSQVWNKTLGNALPFIFQPDNTNNSPDQFAICKFDMKSLKITQSMHRKYNVRLKIEEVW